MKRFIFWCAGALAVLIVVLVLIFNLSAWPPVAIITYAFSNSDQASETGLKKHVPAGIISRRDIACGGREP